MITPFLVEVKRILGDEDQATGRVTDGQEGHNGRGAVYVLGAWRTWFPASNYNTLHKVWSTAVDLGIDLLRRIHGVFRLGLTLKYAV